MFNVNDKRRIYWLINQCLSNKIDATSFCKEYDIIRLEVDRNTFTELEEQKFSELCTIAGRFDPLGRHGADTENELKSKILEIKSLLYKYDSSDKSKIYNIIDQYTSHETDAHNFCDQFLKCYGMEVDPNTLTTQEEKAFSKLADLAVEFAAFEEAFKKYRDSYYTEETLKEEVLYVQEKLSINPDKGS